MSTFHCGPPRELDYLWYVRLILNIERAELHQAIVTSRARRASSGSDLLSQEWADAIAIDPAETSLIYSEALNSRLARLAARMAQRGG